MAIDFSKVKKIIGPGGKEVKKIVRTSDGVVLWQNSAIKKVEFTSPTIECAPMYFGSEYNSYIGVNFHKASAQGTTAYEIYNAFKTASNEGYKYYRFYYKNEHTWFYDSAEEKKFNFSTTMYPAELRTYNNLVTSLTFLDGFTEISHDFGSSKWTESGHRVYTGYLIPFTLSAGTKTSWGSFVATHLDYSGFFDLIGRRTSAKTLDTKDSSYVTNITNAMNIIYTSYFENKNNDFVIEFSKTGTET